jgi:homocysteine S-methyltransferase
MRESRPSIDSATFVEWIVGNMTITTSSIWPDLDTPVVTDGGLETWLLFHHDVELPAFAAYPLVDDERGRALLTDYYERYLDIAAAHDAAALLEAPTWRANPDWALTLGHDRDELGRLIDASMTVMSDLRSRRDGTRPILVSAVIGPRGDGYRVDTAMDPDEAAEYHGFQIDRSARAGADVVTALTLGYVGEAAGVALAAKATGIPSVISFTVETDVCRRASHSRRRSRPPTTPPAARRTTT